MRHTLRHWGGTLLLPLALGAMGSVGLGAAVEIRGELYVPTLDITAAATAGGMALDRQPADRGMYPAITVAARLTWRLGGGAHLVLSHQDHIAFTERDRQDRASTWLWSLAVRVRLGL